MKKSQTEQLITVLLWNAFRHPPNRGLPLPRPLNGWPGLGQYPCGSAFQNGKRDHHQQCIHLLQPDLCGHRMLLICVGAFRDLTFLPVIICNTLVGIVQEYGPKSAG